MSAYLLSCPTTVVRFLAFFLLFRMSCRVIVTVLNVMGKVLNITLLYRPPTPNAHQMHIHMHMPTRMYTHIPNAHIPNAHIHMHKRTQTSTPASIVSLPCTVSTCVHALPTITEYDIIIILHVGMTSLLTLT